MIFGLRIVLLQILKVVLYLGIEEKDRGQKVFVSVGVEDPEKMIEDFGMHYGRSKVSQNILSNKDVKIVNIENKAY